MKRYFNFYHFFMIIPVLILYTNCDGYKSTDDTLSSLSQCANSASHSLKLLHFEPQMDCNNLNLVECEMRSFQPDFESQNSLETICLEHPDYGEICLPITERYYNTDGASDVATDYEVGGPYNHSEYNCHMNKLTHDNEAIFSSTGNSLEESLSNLHSQCLKGGDQL